MEGSCGHFGNYGTHRSLRLGAEDWQSNIWKIWVSEPQLWSLGLTVRHGGKDSQRPGREEHPSTHLTARKETHRDELK